MELTIKSKKLGKEVTFSRPGDGYVYIDLNGKPGTLGQQICYGGALTGDTVTCYGDEQEEFDRVCRNWWALYLRKNRDYL